MPRYFFEVRDRHGVAPDEEGQVLLDMAAARRQAVDSVRSILSDEVKRGCIDLRARIQVSDAGGKLFTLPFAEAVDLRTDPPTSASDGPGIEQD